MSTKEHKSEAVSEHSINVTAMLLRRKWLIVAAGLVGLMLGAAYFLLLPPKYESRAEVLLMRSDAGAMTMGGNEGGDSTVTEQLLATHMKLIHSRRMIEAALHYAELEPVLLGKLESAIEESANDEVGDEGSASEELASEESGDEEADNGKDDNGEDVVDVALDVTGLADVSSTEIQETAAVNDPAETVAVDQMEGIEADQAEEQLVADEQEPYAELVMEGLRLSKEEGLGIHQSVEKILTMDKLSGEFREEATLLTDKSFEERLDYVRENLQVSAGGDGRARDANVMTIAFRHTDPVEAQKITAAILKVYEKFVKEKFQGINSEAANLIVRAREQIELDIEEGEKEYRDFITASPIMAAGESSTNVYQTRYEELAAELSVLALQRDEKVARLKMVESGMERLERENAHDLEKLALIDESNAERMGILVSVERGQAETASFQALQPERAAGATTEYTSLLQMRAKLEQLRTDYGAQHPEVQALQSQINEMQSFIASRAPMLTIGEEYAALTPDDVMHAYVSMLKNDLDAIEQRRLDINKEMTLAEEEAKKLMDFELQEEALVRERSRREELYSSVVERLRDINMQKDATSLIQEVIEEPQVGEQVDPNALMALAITALSSLMLATCMVLVAELNDRSIHDPRDLENIFDSKIIGHLPVLEHDQDVRRTMRKTKKAFGVLDGTLITHHLPKNRMSEVFRALRTQILFAAGTERKVLGITSAARGDGKSTVVANLAISLAQSGRDVLLVDCDLRRPRQHELFGLNNDKGLADVLKDGTDWSDVATANVVKGLTLIPSGGIPESPAELLESPAFENFLESVREKFSYVILDCPPVLPVSDPTIIAPNTDGMLLVVRIDKESKPQALRVQKQLDGVGGGRHPQPAAANGCRPARG